MTQEQIERLAKYATDKYFDCKSQSEKESLTFYPSNFVNTYMRIYELAMQEIVKNNQKETKNDLENLFL